MGTTRPTLRTICMAAILLILAGCGGGGPYPHGVTIAAAGGTARTGDGKVKFTAPAGAVSKLTVITIAKAAGVNADVLVKRTAYSFGPDGTIFNLPLTITIAYDKAAVPSGVKEADLVISTLVGGVWTDVAGSTVDTVDHTVSAPISHLGIYGVVGRQPPATNRFGQPAT